MSTRLTQSAVAALTLGLLAAASPAAFDEGQGTASDHATTKELSPGTLLLGPTFQSSEALGRVVVVEIGGS